VTVTKRLFPAPLVSLTVWLVWLLLNATVEPAHVLLGGLLAVVVPWWADRLRSDRPRIGRPLEIARLGLVVLGDIVLSNIEVARRILGPESQIKPRFIWVPLRLTEPHAILTLAGIVTMTPGTLSADLSADRRYLLVHAFNVDDEAALIAQIKSRYEAPLARIFGEEGSP
jgi:multicomponent K+:H+ antiporter subunit E